MCTGNSREQLHCEIINEAYKTHRNFALVDRAAIRSNGEKIRAMFPYQKILSVLKADAYGHGIEGVLPAYETFSDWYAVATFEEAMLIRAKSNKPILLFGPIPENMMVSASQSNITFTVGDTEYAKKLSKKMVEANLNAHCHLKIDTGLNRSGIPWREDNRATDEIKSIFSLPNLVFSGTYTHFACGEGTTPDELEFTELQFRRFAKACKEMMLARLSVGLRHCCSTGSAIVHPEYRLDMVRLGMLPLGMSFSEQSLNQCGLRPALSWISFVSQIKNIAAGEAVSYSCTFRAEKPMRIGLITCGYADGYHRSYSNISQILVGGKRVRVLGRIAMDYLVADLTDIQNPCIGMPAFLIGTDGIESISALDLSDWSGSVCGEVTCSISKRVPRIYTDWGKV